MACLVSQLFLVDKQTAPAPLLNAEWINICLEDEIICSPDYDILLRRLNETFEHVRRVGIKLNLSKCDIGKKKVILEGHVVSREGFQPDAKNIKAIEKMKDTRTDKETCRYFGICFVYR